jgi:hypothetical protein
VRLTTSLQVGAKYIGCVVCRFHVVADAGSAPCQKPASINLQKWFISPTGRLNLGFIQRENLPLCSSYLPLRVPNWAISTAIRRLRTTLSIWVAPLGHVFCPRGRVRKRGGHLCRPTGDALRPRISGTGCTIFQVAHLGLLLFYACQKVSDDSQVEEINCSTFQYNTKKTVKPTRS